MKLLFCLSIFGFGASAFSFATFLMVMDELFNYFSLGKWNYGFPLIGTFGLWDAWVITYSAIVLSVLMMLVSLMGLLKKAID